MSTEEGESWMRIDLQEAQAIVSAQHITQNQSEKRPSRQLLVDISALVQMDLKTGIHRVTRSILKELLENPPHGYRVEPIFATNYKLGYRYARNFTLRFLDCPCGRIKDAPIEVAQGDVFLGLDWQPIIVFAQRTFLTDIKGFGAHVYFVVYDLLPVLMPQVFANSVYTAHNRWLQTITSFDGAICISRSVADDLHEWMNNNVVDHTQPFPIGWFHLGSDIEKSAPTFGLPNDAEMILSKMEKNPSFLMVGTIEPRKGHAQTLAAFEKLWNDNIQVNLFIVGNLGWMVNTLVNRLRNHPELGKRLFWLRNVSDEYLEKIYGAATCLLLASEGEGFGLPLVEAAKRKLPIVARDIPVFREIAGQHAYYFTGLDANSLSEAIMQWMKLYKKEIVPLSGDMPVLSWAESTENLLYVLLQGNWYIHCLH